MKRISSHLLLLPLLALSSRGEMVHVYQRTVAGTETNQLSDTVLETGASYTTKEKSLNL